MVYAMTPLIERAKRLLRHYSDRIVYIVITPDGHHHTWLAAHRPATRVLGIVGLDDTGTLMIVWSSGHTTYGSL